jgi:hypothetical protein
MPSGVTDFLERDVPFNDDRVELVDVPENRNRSSRGAITGVLLGTGLWGVILVLAGVVKL